MVLGGRENVYSAEVESAIDEHPDVYEVAADGVPHERLGEEVAATVCVRDGRSLDAVQLGEFLDAHLAPFKIHSHWRSVDAPLLRNSAGKMLKTALRSETRAASYSEGSSCSPSSPHSVTRRAGVRSAPIAPKGDLGAFGADRVTPIAPSWRVGAIGVAVGSQLSATTGRTNRGQITGVVCVVGSYGRHPWSSSLWRTGWAVHRRVWSLVVSCSNRASPSGRCGGPSIPDDSS